MAALLTHGLEHRKTSHSRQVRTLAVAHGAQPLAAHGAQPDVEERRPARKRKAGGEQTRGSEAGGHHELCVDIAHAPAFASPSHALPTVCRNSAIGSFVHRRPMLATEKWEAMGLPVWAAECGFPHPWATLVPDMARSRPGRTLSNHVLGALAGNAMHLGVVGAALLWALG